MNAGSNWPAWWTWFIAHWSDLRPTQMKKLRLATAWLDGCSGCHMSALDMDERWIELASLVDLVYSPLVRSEANANEEAAVSDGLVRRMFGLPHVSARHG